ncbi:MOSC domain-containing protein YiiM [Inhella inkyongensis]|uniref:MOSC domain-containing protein YiiM n=1 Tax=Inhella inkyongensis TaxID=392593 RepID=A0A840SB13_9BURK|nr:MOSC domain-containing protein [Inhella inkyongensis]MBB5205661.1 MOSC domain-containing protein YiiM [Inhella inkyongensis]
MRLLSLNLGPVRPLTTLDGRTVPSAIGKQSAVGPVAVGHLGLAGDAQADLSVHGGLARALYAYPSEHLPFWQTVRAQARVAEWGAAIAPGLLGENLLLAGLLESQVWIGDRLVFPNCELLVSEPRMPCFKLNAALGFSQAVKLMSQSGYCGFYLAVQREGSLSAGESFELQPGPREVGIAELFRQKTGR